MEQSTRWGLIESISHRFDEESRRLLGPFCDSYIIGRTDVSQATQTKYGHTKRFLIEMFGADRSLRSITKADAKAWQRWLAMQPVRRDNEGTVIKTMADSTASKHVKRAKTMFGEAVDARLIESSPMDAIKGGDEVNRDRDHFIDRATAKTVLDGCPDHEWRLMFALARFGGFRRCELLSLCWSDVLWDQQRIRNDSPKTGVRFVPIFQELRRYLEFSFEAAKEGQIRCIDRYHRLANLGTQMNRIIERSGVAAWPKTFQNLRASRRTELEERFPNHVVNAWMGHSTRVAEKSYLQITPDHWALGASLDTGSNISMVGGVAGGVIPAYPQVSGAIQRQEIPVNPAPDSTRTLGITCIAPQFDHSAQLTFTELGLCLLTTCRKSRNVHLIPWGDPNTVLKPKLQPKAKHDPLARARFYQSLLDNEVVESRAALSRYLGVTRARVTQVLRRLRGEEE